MFDELFAGVEESSSFVRDNLKPDLSALCPIFPPFLFLFFTAQSSLIYLCPTQPPKLVIAQPSKHQPYSPVDLLSPTHHLPVFCRFVTPKTLQHI